LFVSELLQGFSLLLVLISGNRKSSRPSVLLIYSNDDSAHLDVVKSFAKFMEAHVKCDVLFDEQNDNAATSDAARIEWVRGRLRQSNFVVVIHTRGGAEFLQAAGARQAVRCEHELQLAAADDTFQALYAVLHLARRRPWEKHKFNLLNVYFSYHRPDLRSGVYRIFAGSCFYMMEDIQDFLSCLRGSDLPLQNCKLDAAAGCGHDDEFRALTRAISVCDVASEDGKSMTGVRLEYVTDEAYEGDDNRSVVSQALPCQHPRQHLHLPQSVDGVFIPSKLTFISPESDDGASKCSMSTGQFERRVMDINSQFDRNNKLSEV
jgi:hypothetical protein